jgi:spermidine synthase
MPGLSINYPNIVDSNNQIHSVHPCTSYLTFGPWIYMVPQYKPKSVLMLGYGGGTAVGLIKLFYGEDVEITAVDIEDCTELDFYNINIIRADAQEFVKTCGFYDCIIVDLYGDEGLEPPEFVFSKEFVSNVEKKCNYLIVDATEKSDNSAYKHLHKVKSLALNQNRFHYYMVNRIPELPIR